jgi:hypothetical protein
MSFNDDLNSRIDDFCRKYANTKNQEAISIKIKAETGCFHKSCCPYALHMITKKIYETERNEEYQYIEHESGPEIIAYISLTASGLLLAKSVIELITTIIKARFEGQKNGDNHKGDPITLIIRKTKKKNEVVEERIMTFYQDSKVSDELIEKMITDGYRKLNDNNK